VLALIEILPVPLIHCLESDKQSQGREQSQDHRVKIRPRIRTRSQPLAPIKIWNTLSAFKTQSAGGRKHLGMRTERSNGHVQV
jgi:hypothetical protein